MSKTLVYLIWDHEEDGPEDLQATLSPKVIIQLIDDSVYTSVEYLDRHETDYEELMGRVSDFVFAGKPDIMPLIRGWGGLRVQIVELEG